jgi:hypothetical protein
MVKTFKTNQALISTGFNQPSGQTLTLSGNTIIGGSARFKYATDQHSNYTARSVVDASYVTGQTVNIHHIGFNQQIIYRDVSGITGATGFNYNKATSGVTIPNLCISQSPAIQAGNYFLLTWDSGTTKVNKVPSLSVTGIQGAINGLSVLGDCVCLGGTLTSDTIICGADSYSLSLKNLCSACITTTVGNIVLDSRCNSGGVYLKSQSGAINSPLLNFTNSVGIVMDYPSNIFKIYDCRAGANQRGIEYDSNYSTFYTSRSLVDKEYVDTLANGLHPKQAVQVATVTGITLSGTSQIIDGVAVSDIILGGNRILVKDQIDNKKNGVYSASTGMWGRTGDFYTTAEVVQGSYFFIISGNTNKSTTWVLTTHDIITVGSDPLIFTLFSQITDILAGTGITITVSNAGQHTVSVNGSVLAGNSILWTGNTFNVDINGGTLAIALNSKLAISIFTGYTASTSGLINAAITGATNGLTKIGRNVGLGGALTGDTTITGAYNFNLNTTNINLTGTLTLQSTPTGGTTTDAILVWNSVDKKIKQISQNIVNVHNVFTTYTGTTNDSFIGVSGTSLIYLLPTPICGQRVTVADICGNALSSPITIRSNKRINDSLSCTSLINTNYGSVTFIFNGYFWSAVAFIN